MKVAFATLAGACALLFSAATASGGARTLHPGPLGLIPHSTAGASHEIPTFAVRGSAVCGVSCTSYEASIDQFFSDVAAASGQTTNVYSVATQYSDTTGPIAYASTFGGSYVDTSAYPASGCNDGIGGAIADPVCLSDTQLQDEIQKDIGAAGWTNGGTSLFFILLPSGVGVCYDSSDCSTNVFCAYHSAFGTQASPVIYAVEPYNAAIPGCNPGESPNGDDADASINTISHEQNEAITDPLQSAWYSADANGDEIGDLCAWGFGNPLGGSFGAEWNQVIGGDHYWLQQEYSNSQLGCVQSISQAAGATSPTSGSGPLVYDTADNGPVMRTNTTYAIYWMPNGAPGNTVAPAVSGTGAVNHTLTSTTGSWNSSPTSYLYQWQRCSASGTSCTAIAGANGATYTLQSADGGETVRSTVSGVNGFGASSYVPSAPTTVLPLPTATAAPVLSGAADVGKTLSTTTGLWNTPMTYAYQWLRCDASGAGCAAIAGATTSTYVVNSLDGGHTLEARVSATNDSGTTPALSNLTALVVARPAPTHAPSIAGAAKAGRTLTAVAGSWSNSPTAFGYQWLRCNRNGSHCTKIARATKAHYRATRRDVGHRLRVRVTARNSAGPAGAISPATRRVR